MTNPNNKKIRQIYQQWLETLSPEEQEVIEENRRIANKYFAMLQAPENPSIKERARAVDLLLRCRSSTRIRDLQADDWRNQIRMLASVAKAQFAI